MAEFQKIILNDIARIDGNIFLGMTEIVNVAIYFFGDCYLAEDLVDISRLVYYDINFCKGRLIYVIPSSLYEYEFQIFLNECFKIFGFIHLNNNILRHQKNAFEFMYK